MLRWAALGCALLVLAACAGPPADTGEVESSTTPVSTDVPAVTAVTNPPVTTSMAPSITTATPDTTVTTELSSTTSTSTPTTTATTVPATPTTIDPDSAAAAAWIGVEVTISMPEPVPEGFDMLANLEGHPVDFLVDDEPVGVFGWHVGYTHHAMFGPHFYVVVVGNEPDPYTPGEDREPPERDPRVVHDLMVWAISQTAPASFLISDAMAIRLPATTLGYGALMTVSQEPWWCEIDPSLRSLMLFAYFDRSGELEVDRPYPAHLGFGVEDGVLSPVAPGMISCVLLIDDQ